MRNKNIDLETLAQKLDISPTMHKYAVDRYEGIAQYLEKKGISARFYPQGSFRTGTVVRPLKDGKEDNFDIDEICELYYDKDNISPEYVKKCIGEALSMSKEYDDKLLDEDDRCWTLQYSDVGDVGLLLDIVPAVHEEQSIINSVCEKNVPMEYASCAICITDRENSKYFWVSSNPDGFGKWFDTINNRFLMADIKNQKERYFADNRSLFRADAKVDDVPDCYIHSSLQRVIQILKRHRDIYFYRNKSIAEFRPSSIIITSLTAKIASHSLSTDITELLDFVVNGLQEYAAFLKGDKPNVRFDGVVCNYIDKKDRKWFIPNPVNPDDNYADSWTDDTSKAFFAWVKVVAMDLSQTKTTEEQRYLCGLQTSFGTEFVNRNLSGDRKVKENAVREIVRPTKPWGV